MKEKLVILDCGAQYTKVIDRKVRELGVESDIMPIGTSAEKLKDYGAIIISGGPASVYEKDAPSCDGKIFALNIPVLGICFGMQLVAHHFGGTVAPGVRTEYGATDIEVDTGCKLFDGMAATQTVLMSHGDTVTKLPDGFKVSGKSGDALAGMYNPERRIYCVQFHPEVDLTENGTEMLNNFLRKIVEFKEVFSLEDRIDTAVKMIQKQVGNEKVVVLVSGGVDSAVSAALLLKALPKENVFAIHVDHGLMRKNESDLICDAMKGMGLVNLVRLNAGPEFFHTEMTIDGVKHRPLCELTDPEEKRLVIGTMFMTQLRKAMDSFGLDYDKTFWAQGTLRPDLIESGNPDISGHANKIKTHHNDVDEVRKAREKGMVVETNRDWHKDEVRKVALILGMPEEIAYRQPFPGPGLAMRVLSDEGIKTVTEREKNEFDRVLSQRAPGFEGCVVPVGTVGVQGDHRSYRYFAVVAAGGLDTDWNMVYRISSEIPNNMTLINRVAYVLNKKKLNAPVEHYTMMMTEENVDLVREVDDLVTKALGGRGISQALTVLLPIGTAGKKFSVAIRAVVTNDFMTARPAHIGKEIDADVLAKLVSDIEAKFPEIDLIMYDSTGKPPATVEWQ